MSSSDGDGGGEEGWTQEIHEQQIVNRFDFMTEQNGP
jgi:hypothetical protein